MAKAKNWIFIFPIVCVILMIISLFLSIMNLTIEVPSVPLLVEGDVFPLGGGLLDELEPYISMSPKAETLQDTFMWIGLGYAIFLGLNAFLLFINAIRVLAGNKEIKKARKNWLIGGISLIISQLVIIILMIYIIPDAIEDAGIILSFNIGLGMVFVMISGGILFFTYILAKIVD